MTYKKYENIIGSAQPNLVREGINMKHLLKRTWAEIDLDAARHNYIKIRECVNQDTKIMCVVKADAYGHGAEYLAKEYESLGADWFAVSNIEEGIQLRNSGITKPILILGYTPAYMAEDLAENNISQAILSEKYANELNEEAQKCGVRVNGHIKIDSGMGRIGLISHDPETDSSSADCAERICHLRNLNIEGIFTHFAVADEAEEGRENTLNQFNNFMTVINELEKRGIKIPLKHCGNSSAITDYPETHLDMVRAGVILYGMAPSEKLKGRLDLKPVMQLKSVISLIKRVPKGTAISYGRTYITDKETAIATVPIGYADGYSRAFSNKGYMLVNGRKAPIVGRVCMDQLMLDVTEIKGAEEGIEVTVFGTDKETVLTVDDLAKICGTINYELVCLVGKRVPRFYYKNGKNIGKLNIIVG